MTSVTLERAAESLGTRQRQEPGGGIKEEGARRRDQGGRSQEEGARRKKAGEEIKEEGGGGKDQGGRESAGLQEPSTLVVWRNL